MKNNTIANRFAALALCFVLLFAAAPLPQAFAAPEDETGTSDTNYTEDGSEDTGEDTGGEEGEDRDGEPGRQRPYTVFERLGEVDSGLGLAFA